eukprot:jgi/Ulvmu1/8585/UM045_0028.1
MVRSGDNFVSAIYSNKLFISAFPGLSGVFYTTLQRECVLRLQSAHCPSYASGADAAYTLKMMIMKVAHKDWTAILHQMIVSKAKVLRALMPAVVHHGCEATLKPGGAPLGPALPLQFSGTNKDAPSNEDLQKVTFRVTLPSYVHCAISSILQAAEQASNGPAHRACCCGRRQNLTWRSAAPTYACARCRWLPRRCTGRSSGRSCGG